MLSGRFCEDAGFVAKQALYLFVTFVSPGHNVVAET